MPALDELTRLFESERRRLRAIAYRMLGSLTEADDAVQESWIRLNRANTEDVANLSGWLTTVTSRICLDMLRTRTSRAEDLMGFGLPDLPSDTTVDPEQEVVQADSVGRALLVVLDRLGPAERVAFVLHDLFAVPFDEIAPVVDRKPTAAKKLASRARLRVHGTPAAPDAELTHHRQVTEAFLAAARTGDVTALLEILAPDVIRRADRTAVPAGVPLEVRGAKTVADETRIFGRRARFAEIALIDGQIGVVVAPQGRLLLALRITIDGNQIAAYDVIANPDRLHHLTIALGRPAR